jgi:translation initiation factor 2D
MTPGLQRGPPFPKKATKGAIVAIASLESPTVPMAVGTCEIDVSSLEKVQGMKGAAVSTFHWAGDELWSWSSAGKLGINPPEHLEGWDDEKDEDEDAALALQAAAMDLDDEDGGVALETDPTERSAAEKAQGIEGEDPSSLKDAFEMVDEKELTQKGTISIQTVCTVER